MAAGFSSDNQTLCFAKGDPEVILKMCTRYMTASGGMSRMDGDSLQTIRAVAHSANQRGDIAIALGYGSGTTVPLSIFARLSPSQKGILVRLLRERGHCVAMVGDGANDVIALRMAEIGVAFEESSPLAKRVSRIIIRDLADLLTMIAGARRIERWLEYLTLFRIAALILVLVGLYAWMLG